MKSHNGHHLIMTGIHLFTITYMLLYLV